MRKVTCLWPEATAILIPVWWHDNGSVHVLHLSSSSVDVIHGWGFSIHGWHSQMTLSSMGEVSPSMDDIHGWHFYPWMRFIHSWMRFIHPCMELSSVTFWSYRLLILTKIAPNFVKREQNLINDKSIHGWENLIHEWKCHLWISSMDGGASLMDESVICGCHHRWRNLIHGRKCHPCMTLTDEDYGYGRSLNGSNKYQNWNYFQLQFEDQSQLL